MTLLEIRLLASKLPMSVAVYFLSECRVWELLCARLWKRNIKAMHYVRRKSSLESGPSFNIWIYDENGNSLRAVLLENLNFEADV